MDAKKGIIVQIQKELEMQYNESDLYDQDFLNESLDNDMISAEEQGFMIGYLGDTYV